LQLRDARARRRRRRQQQPEWDDVVTDCKHQQQQQHLQLGCMGSFSGSGGLQVFVVVNAERKKVTFARK
jgi:hypothetical protein